ncbi:Uncharacterised protein [Mycobacteroides abscessus subsp. abscessus]|nr:Uncharacterised protein [Mycobacteroides abscessus subsp. abscessus]
MVAVIRSKPSALVLPAREWMPALFTSVSIRGCVAAISCAAARTESRSARSA